MKIVLFIIGTVFILSGLSMVLCNYAYLVMNYINRRKGIDKHHSWIPLLGSVFTLIGIYISPLEFKKFYLLIFVLDPGTLFTFMSLPWFFKRIRNCGSWVLERNAKIKEASELDSERGEVGFCLFNGRSFDAVQERNLHRCRPYRVSKQIPRLCAVSGD